MNSQKKRAKSSSSSEKSTQRSEKESLEIHNRRYLGSKYKLVEEIRKVVKRYCGDAKVFADVFAGTGVVAAAFPEMRLITNDILYSNHICHQAWFLAAPYSKRKVKEAIAAYNAMSVEEDNYMSRNFAGTYFSASVCRKIGFVREDIEKKYKAGELNERERALLVTSLLYAMDKIANTVGHYDAYRKCGTKDMVLEMRIPVPPHRVDAKNECFNEDANALVRRLKCDILFLDPPYNSRQYSDAYHLLENVAKWEKPPVKGVARKMDRIGLKNAYCTRKAEHAFADLIASADAKYIILTYNNMEEKGNARSNARLSDAAIMKALGEKGETRVFSVAHKAFSAGKSARPDNVERIFLCECGERRLVASPLNYTGGKYKILPQLLDAFPRKIDTFVDLFCGGGSVGVNVRANRIVMRDSCPQLIDLLRTMRSMPGVAFMAGVEALIAKFGLSESDKHGYAYYGCESSCGLGIANKTGYMRLRRHYAKLSNGSVEKSIALYALIVYAFNNQMRFNGKGEFNLPVGKRDFNSKMRRKVAAFAEAIKADNVSLRQADFRSLDIASLGAEDLVYADPPYLVTCASYNESGGWTEQDERDLLALLDSIDNAGSRFALSNVTTSKGRRNEILLAWIEQNSSRYRVIPVHSDYSNSNYQRKTAGDSCEVLVVNLSATRFCKLPRN